MKKSITCESFLDYQFVSDPRISPDGKHTAFIVKKADIKANTYQSSLYLFSHETNETKQMTSLGSVNSFIWEDNQTILFASVRSDKVKEAIKSGEEIMSFHTLDITGGEAKESFILPVKGTSLIPVGGDNYAVIASFDNERPDVEGLDESEKKKRLLEYKNRGYEHIREVPFTVNGGGYISRIRNRLYLYNRKTGKIEALTDPMFNVAGVKAEQGRILYIGQKFEDVKSLKNGVYLYDTAAKKSSCLLEPGRYLIKGFDLYQDKAVLNLTDGESYGNGQNGDFYTIDIQTKEQKLLLSHEHHCVGNTVTTDVKLGGGQTMKKDGKYLYFTSTVDMDCIIERLDMESGECLRITDKGSVDFLDVKDGKLVCTAFTESRLEELYECKDGKLCQLTHLNDFVQDEYDVCTPEYIEVKGNAPWEIQGYVLKPADYVPGKKYPGILAMHGGPRLTYGPVFMHQMQTFANAGYFVFFCNPRGSEGRGNEFGDIRRRFGEINYQDFMEFTDGVLKKYPDIDAGRIGVEGGSYGGFMTNWIIGHTDRFAAVCSQRSIANWTSMEGSTDIGYYFCKGQTGASHMEDHELQWKQSPLASADKCTTPTLFIHGEKDYRCYMGEAFQMFAALKLHGCDAKLCLFEGENHELSRSGRPKQRLKRLEEMKAWFDKYLMKTDKEV